MPHPVSPTSWGSLQFPPKFPPATFLYPCLPVYYVAPLCLLSWLISQNLLCLNASPPHPPIVSWVFVRVQVSRHRAVSWWKLWTLFAECSPLWTSKTTFKDFEKKRKKVHCSCYKSLNVVSSLSNFHTFYNFLRYHIPPSFLYNFYTKFNCSCPENAWNIGCWTLGNQHMINQPIVSWCPNYLSSTSNPGASSLY